MKIRYSEFRDRIDLDQVEAALGFTPLTHDKGNDIGHCLFPANHSHGDTTGKFAIHRDKLVYNCWVCGGGSLLSLVMEVLDLDVDQATEWLYPFATGTDSRSDTEFRDYLLELLDDIEERHESLPYFNPRVLERYDTDYEYFTSRGISPDICRAFDLCYSDQVLKPAPKKNKDGEVIKIDEDYIGPAAIFPHYWQGQLVGWQHRWLDYDEGTTPVWLGKYTNTTDFPKDSTIFNYDRALKSREPVIVLESVPSALFVMSHALNEAVAYFGGGIKPAQLRLLRRFSQGVVLCPDNDETGDKFVRAATEYLERFIPVYHADKVQFLGEKADLGDYAKTREPQRYLLDHLNNRVHRAGVEL